MKTGCTLNIRRYLDYPLAEKVTPDHWGMKKAAADGFYKITIFSCLIIRQNIDHKITKPRNCDIADDFELALDRQFIVFQFRIQLKNLCGCHITSYYPAYYRRIADCTQ